MLIFLWQRFYWWIVAILSNWFVVMHKCVSLCLWTFLGAFLGVQKGRYAWMFGSPLFQVLTEMENWYRRLWRSKKNGHHFADLPPKFGFLLFLTSHLCVAVADPGFPRRGGANSPGGTNIWFCQIFSKTAWNWKNLDWGGAVPRDPLRSTLCSLTLPDIYYCCDIPLESQLCNLFFWNINAKIKNLRIRFDEHWF